MGDNINMVRIGNVRTFQDVEPDKGQAKKVLEEAAEVYGAWDQWSKSDGQKDISEICEEACDLVTALSNLLSALGVHDLNYHMMRCEGKNLEKGRY